MCSDGTFKVRLMNKIYTSSLRRVTEILSIIKNGTRASLVLILLLAIVGTGVPITTKAATQSGGVTKQQGGTVFASNSGLITGQQDVDAQTGAFSYSYDIALPPGRSDLSPSVTLIYNSGDRDPSSLLGHGWSLSIPSISRMNKLGVDKVYTRNDFVSDLDGELVSVGGGAYKPRVEKGEFHSYFYSNGYWQVKDNTGITYTFGSTAATQTVNPNNASQVYTWHLNEIRDANDNFIKFEYFKDQNQVYIDKIIYTGNGTTNGVNTVEFIRENRSDTNASYGTGFLVKTEYRITEVQVKANNTLVTKYDLQHNVGENTSRSLLTGIVETAFEGASSLTLPTVSFDYSLLPNTSQSWSTANSYTLPQLVVSSHSGVDQGVRYFDVNGDGYADAVKYFNSNLASGTVMPTSIIYLNTGSSFSTSTTWTLPQPVANKLAFAGTDNTGTYDLGARFVDVNDDGYTDIMWSINKNIAGYGNVNIRKTYINNKTDGWTESTQWAPPSDVYFNADATANGTGGGNDLADVNGDGLIDIIKAYRYSTNGGSSYTSITKTYLNTGSGWQQTGSQWNLPQPIEDNITFDVGTRIVDLNGDGLVDVLRHVDSQYNQAVLEFDKAYLNTGNGWVEDTSGAWKSPMPFVKLLTEYGPKSLGTRLVDINGDGLTDIFAYETGALTASQKIYVNTGKGWSDQTSTWAIPANALINYAFTNAASTYVVVDAGVRLSDFDGDNMIDFMKYGPTNTYPNNAVHVNQIMTHSGDVPDLLKTITLTQGGVIDVTYEQSARYKENGNLLNTKTAINLDTVKDINTNDLFGNTVTESYVYAGGSHYYASSTDRRFAGFGKITKTTPINKQETWYHQANGNDTASEEVADSYAKIGLPYQDIVSSLSGNIYTRHRTNWTTFGVAVGSEFTQSNRETTLQYDGNSSHSDTAVEYTYNNTTGHATQMIEYGKVNGNTNGSFSDTGDDKRTTDFQYAINTTNNIVLPSKRTIKNNSGVVVAESRTYYDGLAHNSVTKGNRTKEEQWVSGTTYVNTQWQYNSFGLVTRETDPLGRHTYFGYDPYNLFVASTTNPLGHNTRFTYDYSSGNVATTTTANGTTYATTYDALDRPLVIKVPDPDTGVPVVTATYNYTDTKGAVAVKTTKYLTSILDNETYSYYDGFGRLIQERSEAEDNNQFRVKDIIYGNNGLAVKESLPYFGTGSARNPATTNFDLLNEYTYDPLGRVVNVSNTIGNTSTMYDDWKETITDTAGTPKGYTYDAYGRLVKVSEHNGGDTYHTTYTWNTLDLLTKITDAENNIRSITYDPLGRRLSLEDLHDPADNTFGIWTFAYDAVGNITSKVDPKNQTIQYTYDTLNRPLTENFTGTAGNEVTYTYDTCAYGKGQLCSATNSAVATTYTYRPSGQVASEARTIDGTTYTTSYRYDRQGHQVLITQPNNSEIEYQYNQGNQVEQLKERSAGGTFAPVVSDVDYGPHGQMTYLKHRNNSETIRTYDAGDMYRLKRIQTNAVQGSGGGGGGDELAAIEAELAELDTLSQPTLAENTLESVSDIATNTEVSTTTKEEVTDEVSMATSSTDSTYVEKPIIFGVATSTNIENISLETSIVPTTPLTTDAVPLEVVFAHAKDIDIKNHIKNENDARVWHKYHKERVKGLEKSLGATSSEYQNALRTLDEFEASLIKAKYLDKKDGTIDGSVLDWVRGKGKKTVENILSFVIPETAYAYLFGTEAFESCAALPCSLTTNHTWGGVATSLDATSKVYGEDSLKALTTGQGGGGQEKSGLQADELYGKFSVYIPANLSYGSAGFFNIFQLEDSNSGTIMWLSVQQWNGAPRLIISGAAVPWINTELDLSEGINTIQVRYKKGSGTGDIDVWLNNNNQNNPSYNGSNTLNTGTASVDGAIFGVVYAPNAISTIYSDDFTVDSAFISAGTPPPFVQKVQDLNYTYDTVGNITTISDDSDTISKGTLTYTYDTLSRLLSASTTLATTTPYKHTFTYTPIGNMLTNSVVGSYLYEGGINSYADSIFTDTLSAAWDNWSWGGTYVDSSTQTHTGTHSLKATYTSQYAGLQLRNGALNTTPYSHLTFAFYLESGTTPDIKVKALNKDTNTELGQVSLINYLPNNTYRRAFWQTVSIPLSALNFTNFQGNGALVFQSDSSPTVVIYLDDIRLTGTSNGTTIGNPHAATTIAGVPHTYDKNGNLLHDGTISYTYNYRNELIETVNNTGTTTYSYDHTGSRIKKTTPHTTTRYLSPYYELENTLPTEYYYLGDTIVAKQTNTTLTALHTDHLSSIAAGTLRSGHLESVSLYYPYGTLRQSARYTSDSQTKQYLGEDYDPETQLSYLNARYYTNSRGGFTSQDPVFWEMGTQTRDSQRALLNPQAQNSYSYAGNSPIGYKDPDGRIAAAAVAPMFISSGPVGWVIAGGSAVIFGGIYLVSELFDPDTLKTETLQEANPYELMSYPAPQDPNDLKPPKDNLPKWKKNLYRVGTLGYLGYEVTDTYEDYRNDVEKLNVRNKDNKSSENKNILKNIDQDPRSSNVSEARKYYDKAKAAYDKGDYKTAQKYAEKANYTLNKK
jgi:RHS repeat-associated protein